MIRVGILGATGYTGLELIKLLLRHPEAEIVRLTSRQEGRPHIASVHPQLSGRLNLVLEEATADVLADECDVVFSCLPHGASSAAVRPLVELGCKVIDLSADYRLRDGETYRKWYGDHHADIERLGKVPYGLPELFADEIRTADLVANPGCYPTSAILPIAALVKLGLIEPVDLVVDSKSGVSGAGRTPSLTTHFPECNESVAAYGVGHHRHAPEMAQIASLASGTEVELIFTPHLIPMDRGILTTIYARPTSNDSPEKILEALRGFYNNKPFVRIVDHLPATKHVTHTNYCDITVRRSGKRIVIISCLDNLIKGASGAAVQNMNIMFGLSETAGLL
ncbi:MAG: N-acetyl-gamma-glutamyl-phosphate reductase [Pirellulaceae bacterium]|nr:MAG: N-acetyl-gamma-glutamyl-phosphate reductase [Pirellulaceae bacterium]GIW94718.1 MAG: N-acetyl-gamma-glutamyl-phosphate reductase [Pirellulaceae bacterium]